MDGLRIGLIQRLARWLGVEVGPVSTGLELRTETESGSAEGDRALQALERLGYLEPVTKWRVW